MFVNWRLIARCTTPKIAWLTKAPLQNKKRKYSRDDGDEGRPKSEEPEDPLKDATTLYVGNL